MHYFNTAFDLLGNCLLEKRNYVVIESSYYCVKYIINMKFYRFIAAFLFFFVLKDKKLKKLAVALKFLTVLSLNSSVFC